MTTHVGDDFDEFVAARWPDLEAVALVATLDPEPARELTVETLAALRARWRDTLEDGAPTATARRDLLERVARANRTGGRIGGPPGRRGHAHSGPGRPETTRDAGSTDAAVLAAVADDATSVPARLVDALAAEAPLVRAAGAATVLWDLRPDELATLLGRSATDVLADVGSARHRLLEAHRAARAEDGLDPADHRFDDDLADALHRLTLAHTAAPDLDRLVHRRAARVRRRHVVLGTAGAVVVAGAAGYAVLGREDVTPADAGGPPGPALPAADDVSWRTTATWSPRGSLRADPSITAILVDPVGSAAQLVYAGDVEGRRVVVASEGTVALAGELRLWTGPAGTPPEQLSRVELGIPGIYDDVALVALGVPHPDGALLLVLGRPTVREAQLSYTVHPTPEGTIDRTWEVLPLAAGVGTALLGGPPGLASRLRCDGYDGPLPRPSEWDAARNGGSGSDPVGDLETESRLATDVAVATGVPRDRLGSTTSTHVLPGRASIFNGAVTGTVTVRLQQVRTPDGAVVRSAYVEARSADSSPVGFNESAIVVPADAADSPYLTEIDESDTDRGTFALITSTDAASVRLYGDSGTGDPLGPAAPVHRGAAVFRSRVRRPPARLVVRDAHGELLYDGPPVQGRWLFDLYDMHPGDV